MWYALGALLGLCLLVALVVAVVKGRTAPSTTPATPAPTAGGGTPTPVAAGAGGGSSWKKKLIGGGLVVLGIVLMLWASPTIWKKLASRPPKSNGMATNTPYNNVSMDTALQIRADCETGGGVTGAAHQFLPGTKTPVRNPQNGKAGTGAVGRYQINLSDSAVAKVVKDHKWDVEGSEADNRTAAEFLYREFVSKGGTDPWEASKHCWGPKLAAMGTSQQVATALLGVVDVPVDGWSKEIPNPSLGRVRWGRLDLDKGGSCEVMMDKDPKRVFPIAGEYPRITPQIVQFKCSEEGARISVKAL